MVQGHERRQPVAERGLEQVQARVRELAVVDPLAGRCGDERVERHQTHPCDVVDEVERAGPVGPCRAQVLRERGSHVVVAGDGHERDGCVRQQLDQLGVLGVQTVVGQVARQQDDVRQRVARHEVLQGAAQPARGLRVRTDVAVGQVRDDDAVHGASLGLRRGGRR